MEELLRSLSTIRDRLHNYGDWLTGIDSKYPDHFAMIFNATTLSLELLDHYFQIWKGPFLLSLPADKIQRMRDENSQRVNEVTKWLFISALSSVEYAAKEMLKATNGESFQKLRETLQRGKRVHLSTIIDRSKQVALIDEEEYKTWQVLMSIRNTVIHNNAIADIDAEYNLGDMEVNFTKGKMLRGKLDFFIKLLGIAIDQYYKWLRAIHDLRLI